MEKSNFGTGLHEPNHPHDGTNVVSDDRIRDVVSAQADRLGLTAYAIGQLADLNPNTVKRYLTGRCSLNSRYVSKICDVLDLELRSKAKP